MANKPLVADVFEQHGTAVLSVPADTPLKGVIEALVRHPSARGICLVDAKQKFVGMITRVNLLMWARLNLSDSKDKHNMPISDFFRIVDAQKAKDLTPGASSAFSVKENDYLQTAIDKMLDLQEDVIPVLNEEGAILGDLRLSEVLWWAITKGKSTEWENKK